MASRLSHLEVTAILVFSCLLPLFPPSSPISSASWLEQIAVNRVKHPSQPLFVFPGLGKAAGLFIWFARLNIIMPRLIRFGAASPSCTCGHLSAAGSAAPVLMAGGSSHHLLIPALCPVLPLVSRCKYNTVYQILKTRQYSGALQKPWFSNWESTARPLFVLVAFTMRCFPPECFSRTPNQSHDAFTRSSFSCFRSCQKLFSCSLATLADLFSDSFEDAPCCFRVTSLITCGVFPAAWLREMEAFGCFFFPRRGGALWWISMLSITLPPAPSLPRAMHNCPGLFLAWKHDSPAAAHLHLFIF